MDIFGENVFPRGSEADQLPEGPAGRLYDGLGLPCVSHRTELLGRSAAAADCLQPGGVS